SAPEPVFRADAEFLVKHTDRCTKFALPSPFLIAIRYWHPDYSALAYPSSNAGIDIIQLDDPALTYFCDRRLTSGAGDIHDERLRSEWDIDKQFPHALAAINQITEGL